MSKQMGIHVEGAIFKRDGTNLDLWELLEKLESVGLEMGASTQPIDEEGGLYMYMEDWKTGDYLKNYFEE